MDTETLEATLVQAAATVYAQVFVAAYTSKQSVISAQIDASAAMKDFLMEARKHFGKKRTGDV